LCLTGGVNVTTNDELQTANQIRHI
jgi:hypothetical protein